MIYIIVPVFKRIKKTKKFLESIKTISKTHNLKVILVDDDSDHETLHYFQNFEYKFLTIIKGTGGLWWGGSINKGINYLTKNFTLIDNDLCIFANNDVTIDIIDFEILIKRINLNKNILVHPRTFNHMNDEISSGSKILYWIPFITQHPKDIINDIKIDLGTARFLCMNYKILRQLKNINKDLPQYIGDNDFTLRAQKIGFETYIIHNAQCLLDDSETGLKNVNIVTLKEVWKSLFSIKSANNIKYKLIFLKSHHSTLKAYLILISMVINIFGKFLLKKIRKS